MKTYTVTEEFPNLIREIIHLQPMEGNHGYAQEEAQDNDKL